MSPEDFEKPAELAEMSNWEFALRSLNPREQLILDGETNGRGRNLNATDTQKFSGTESKVEITNYTPNEVKLSASIPQPTWLVLADSYFPGWKAYAQSLDSDTEIELTIHRADGNFRAVYLQPGQWNVRFRYSPQSFQLGLYASFLSMVTLIFLLGVWAWGKLYREQESDSPIKRIAKNSMVPMTLALSNRVIDFVFAMLMLRILQPEGAGRYAFAVTSRSVITGKHNDGIVTNSIFFKILHNSSNKMIHILDIVFQTGGRSFSRLFTILI